MYTLHSQQMWDLVLQRHAEMLQEAQREHLARMAKQPQTNWLKNLFSRPAQNPALELNPSAINPNATPELG